MQPIQLTILDFQRRPNQIGLLEHLFTMPNGQPKQISFPSGKAAREPMEDLAHPFIGLFAVCKCLRKCTVLSSGVYPRTIKLYSFPYLTGLFDYLKAPRNDTPKRAYFCNTFSTPRNRRINRVALSCWPAPPNRLKVWQLFRQVNQTTKRHRFQLTSQAHTSG